MRRRVGSASAAKVRFSVREEYLTIRLTISGAVSICKQFFVTICRSRRPRRLSFVRSPILKRLRTPQCAFHISSESIGLAPALTTSPFIIVEAFVSNALSSGAWHKRRYNDIYGSDAMNTSLFTTYGILVGSPP